MAEGPKFTGLGGYGPWPDNDKPLENQDPSPHYPDGYANRGPDGTHFEQGSDIWLDALVYPARSPILTDAQDAQASMRARAFVISNGNVTGKKPGPSF